MDPFKEIEFLRQEIEELKRRGYLGLANSWNPAPQIYTDCKHDKEEFVIRNRLYMRSCEKCGFWYKVDTSG